MGPGGWRWRAAEAAVALGAAAVLPLLCLNIQVDPMKRIGQVSGMASMGLRYTLCALVLIAITVVAARARRGAGFEATSRLVFAAIAGLATGVIAGGILVALHGTPFGLNGLNGDAGDLVKWTDAVRAGKEPPPTYPPLAMYMLAGYADILDISSAHAMKHMQVIGTALLGPATYLSWRLVLRPGWALGVGVIAALPLIQPSPYKPYANVVLMMLVPIVIAFLRALRRAGDETPIAMARLGVAYGAGFGVLCLIYSGWFQWSAPGVLVAALILFPWRGAARNRALVLCAAAAVMFALVAGRYTYAVLTDPVMIADDNYIYFDVGVEPAYVAMWRGDLPGNTGPWPPHGELGGVGLFTIVMVAGTGLAIALGRSRTAVIAVASMLAGCWLLRFWYAHFLWETRLVQYYPRTTAQISYCLLVLCGLAVFYTVERLSREHPVRTQSGVIGSVCALLLLFGFTGSAITDHHMPNGSKPISMGWLAYMSHQFGQGQAARRATPPRDWPLEKRAAGSSAPPRTVP